MLETVLVLPVFVFFVFFLIQAALVLTARQMTASLSTQDILSEKAEASGSMLRSGKSCFLQSLLICHIDQHHSGDIRPVGHEHIKY